jgi:hypothetical protein
VADPGNGERDDIARALARAELAAHRDEAEPSEEARARRTWTAATSGRQAGAAEADDSWSWEPEPDEPLTVRGRRGAGPRVAGQLGRFTGWGWLAAFGVLWGQSTLVLGTIGYPVVGYIVPAIAMEIAGLYTVALWLTRRRWVPLLSGHPRRNAIVLGTVSGALVQLLLLVAQIITLAPGESTFSLATYLVLMVPWFAGVVSLFVRAQDRWRFSLPAVLLLGGLYGAAIDLLFGGDPVQSAVTVLLIGYWRAIISYSSAVLLPALLVASREPPERPAGSAWVDAVSPLAWLLVFFVYVPLVLTVLPRG